MKTDIPAVEATIESPCIKVCKLDPATDLCTGCLRSLAEIRAWRDASNDEKRAIVAAAQQRRLGELAA
ncbi:MAG TPA: DUF1289 domain-containing protein [Roseateles sp.]|jgi:hypothetical protein|nr:DUF1289 domain-containing protein [Roseateles sp.]HWT55045.1 DUF1289 domain-containing protein [Rhodocyclaceae bacterium]